MQNNVFPLITFQITFQKLTFAKMHFINKLKGYWENMDYYVPKMSFYSRSSKIIDQT